MKTSIEAMAVPTTITSVTKMKNDLRHTRLAREEQTMTTMVRIFCRDHHRPAAGLCVECQQFWIMPVGGWNAAASAWKSRPAPSVPSIAISASDVNRCASSCVTPGRECCGNIR
jgi:hypothetical protein